MGNASIPVRRTPGFDLQGRFWPGYLLTNMDGTADRNERCPYSDPPYAAFTDDHIFPQFLGGRRTIRVCKQCNDVFGHTFEGRASRQLKRLQVFISHFGLDLTRTPASWPAAIVIDGATYDLQSGPECAQ